MVKKSGGTSIGRGKFLRQLFQSLYGGTGDKIAAPLPSGKSLVHYTNLNTLIGIVSNDDLWMTDARYSNDRQEIIGGFTAVKNRVKSKLRRDKDFSNRLDDWLSRREDISFYVSCFCTDSDLLSQWRAYGADGEGISISLDGAKLSKMCRVYIDTGTFILAPVVYDDEEKNSLIDKVLAVGRALDTNVNTQARVISFALAVFAATFKSRLFKEEGEWRLLFVPISKDPASSTAEIHFRARRDLVAPFVKLRSIGNALGDRFKMGKLPIERVRLGPSLRPLGNFESVDLLFKKHGFESVQVRRSKIPYRRQSN